MAEHHCGITSKETRFSMAENVVTSVLVKLGIAWDSTERGADWNRD
jgi:hypothetical protein